MDLQEFKDIVWQHYFKNKRYFLWREELDPYFVVVSEIMLQQTQTHRVVPKFDQFITRFASFAHLASASFADVLAAWHGLGYNRRAKYLHHIAQRVMTEFDGKLPSDPQVLKTFPGIGPNTAGSICAFAFNKPVVFIETNIRSVFIAHFFTDRDDVNDAELFPLIEQTVCCENPREWYYALMDYGVMLKRELPNPSRKSAHHTKQSKFEGSDRQIRGMILKCLIADGQLNKEQLLAKIDREPQRIERMLQDLCTEGMVQCSSGSYVIS